MAGEPFLCMPFALVLLCFLGGHLLQEIFGPVLSVMRFSSEEEAVALANDTTFGLGASPWINSSHQSSPALPSSSSSSSSSSPSSSSSSLPHTLLGLPSLV